jgi:hypothetical protein
MNKHGLRFIFSISVIGLCILIVIVGCTTRNSLATTEDLERAIHREIPAGSSKSDVVRFLTAHHIEYSADDQDGVPTILGVVRDVKGSIVKESIQVKFTFSSQGKLEGYKVKQVLTGP